MQLFRLIFIYEPALMDQTDGTGADGFLSGDSNTCIVSGICRRQLNWILDPVSLLDKR